MVLRPAFSSIHDTGTSEPLTTRPAIEFYDLQKDPYELNNLAGNATNAKMIATYTTQLKEWMQQQHDEGAAEDKEFQHGQKE